MLKKNYGMIAIDGRERLVRVTRIEVATPYFEGETKATVLDSVICDLVLGNISGVLDKPDKKFSQQSN